MRNAAHRPDRSVRIDRARHRRVGARGIAAQRRQHGDRHQAARARPVDVSLVREIEFVMRRIGAGQHRRDEDRDPAGGVPLRSNRAHARFHKTDVQIARDRDRAHAHVHGVGPAVGGRSFLNVERVDVNRSLGGESC